MRKKRGTNKKTGSKFTQVIEGRLLRVLTVLQPRHVAVLVGYYYDRKSQSQLSLELGVSQRWVSELLKEALKRLEEAGLPLPSQTTPGDLKLCPPSYLDQCLKNANGTYKKPEKTDAGHPRYRPH